MPSGPDTLSQSLFDMLYAELFNGIKNMFVQFGEPVESTTFKGVGGTDSENRQEDTLEGDKYMYRILRLLYIVSSSKVCQKSLSSAKWISLLIAGIGSGESGVQRRILRLLRRMLVNMNPSHIVAFIPTLYSNHDEIMQSDTPLDDDDFSDLIESDTSSAERIVSILFQGVSTLSLIHI